MIDDSEDAARAFVAELAPPHAMAGLERYADMLREESSRQNLVAAATLPHIWHRHFADSAQLLEHVPRETSPWLDLGSGAGLPGVVLALLQPVACIVMVESRRKRIDWLHHVASELSLPNMRVEGRRLEHVETIHAAAITARAFAPLPKLLKLSARFSTEQTRWVLPKGRSAREERDALPESIRRMFHVKQSQTDADAAILVGQGRIST